MKKYILSAASIVLLSSTSLAQTIDINQMPKPGVTPTVNFNQPKSFQLKNGLTVLVVEDHKLPRVNTNLTIDRPPILEGQKAGIFDIMGALLGSGTPKVSKDEFNKRIDFLGASVSFSSQGAFANTLSKYYPDVLKLMADAIVNAQFNQDELNSEVNKAIEGLKSEEKNTSAIAEKVFSALTYGKNTSRGEFTTEASYKNIQLADIQKAYKNYYSPNQAYLVVVGDVQFDEVKKWVENSFGDWQKSKATFAPLEKPNPISKTEINVVDVPSSVQSVIKIGNLTQLVKSNPKSFSAIAANYILGGGGEARLFQNLREKNAFTYGAYSSLSMNKYSPSFSAESSVRNEVTDKAVKEFLNELKAISTIKPEELAKAKAKLKGQFIMSLEKPETIARFALSQKVDQLPADFYKNYLKSVDEMTLVDVQNASKLFINQGQLRIFIAGKASDFFKSVEALGFAVNYYDAQANPTKKPEIKAVDASVTVKSIGEKYLTAIGGKAKVETIKSIIMTSSATIQGMEIEMKDTSDTTGRKAVLVSMMGNVVQKIVFDGKEGYTEAQGTKMPMPAEMKTKYLANAQIFPELNYGSAKDVVLKGIEKMDGEDAYVVKSDNTNTYYSVATGLKLAEVITSKNKEQQVTVPTYFSDYKEVNSVKMPYTIKTQNNGMDMEFKVKSYEVNTTKDEDFK